MQQQQPQRARLPASKPHASPRRGRAWFLSLSLPLDARYSWANARPNETEGEKKIADGWDSRCGGEQQAQKGCVWCRCGWTTSSTIVRREEQQGRACASALVPGQYYCRMLLVRVVALWYRSRGPMHTSTFARPPLPARSGLTVASRAVAQILAGGVSTDAARGSECPVRF